jgi:hypothetical protein
LTRQRFAAEALAVVRSHPEVERAWLDEQEFAVRFVVHGSREAAWLFLRNTFAELGTAPVEARRARIEQMITASTAAEPDWPEVLPLLRPVLRGDALGLLPPFDGRTRLRRPALPYLSEFVVVDQPTSMAYLTADRVRQWGVEPAEVFAAARKNVAELQGQRSRLSPPEADAYALFCLTGDADAYFTSWPLIDGYLAGVADELGGRPVIFMPDATTLMIMVDRPEVVAQLLPMIDEQYGNAPRQLSPAAYTVDASGAVVPYRAGEPGELADRLHRAEVRLAVDEYTAQKRALQIRYEQDGVDLYVSELMGVDRPDGSRFSTAVWPVGTDALLPEADFIGVVASGDPVTVPWPIVRAEVGLQPEPDLAPPRYRVTAALPPEVLARLHAEAVTP